MENGTVTIRVPNGKHHVQELTRTMRDVCVDLVLSCPSKGPEGGQPSVDQANSSSTSPVEETKALRAMSLGISEWIVRSGRHPRTYQEMESEHRPSVCSEATTRWTLQGRKSTMKYGLRKGVRQQMDAGGKKDVARFAT